MDLKTFIEQQGEAKAAKLFKVSVSTIRSWRYSQRFPRPAKAQEIIKKSPVTMDGIYGAR